MKLKKLDDVKAGIEGQVDAARMNAEVIVPQVETWLDDVYKIQANMSSIEPEILNLKSRCLAIKSRFSLSRKATKMVAAMKVLQDDQGKFGQISHPALPAAMTRIPLGQTCELQSRKDFEEDIMTTLRENKVSMMGISGMGGVGKTTLAKKIMSRAREEGLFVDIMMVVVSQSVDMLRIQKEMAELLGLRLKVESLPARAHLLRARLINSKSVLIVLDDLWKGLNLEDLGIPYQQGECRIILTSRDRDVFTAMNVEKTFQMKTLEAEEAWSLFKEKVGACAEDQVLFPIAQQIVRECNGLPIALVTVGMALKYKTNKSIWEDALHDLRSYNPRDIPGFLAEVYNPLKLSYDLLESEHARSIFLLCCLFPEDHNICISYLSHYVWGLGMFEGVTSLQVAKNKVEMLVEMLKSHFLLLDADNDKFTKMHDVVRDVGIFIATNEGLMDPNLTWKSCTWISLFDKDKITLPGGSSFPNLHFLLIEGPHSSYERATIEPQPLDNFFESARYLNVLSIGYYILTSLPRTIQLQKNLRTLTLYNCSHLEDISVVGELVHLEILNCHLCNSVKELPVEIGRLKHLKLLDVSFCDSLEILAAGVISKLTKLEELTLIGSFKKWEMRGLEGKSAALCELNSLSNLTTLRIEIENASLVAEQIHLSPKLVEFQVLIGHIRSTPVSRSTCRKEMQLELFKEVILGDWIHQLLRTTEVLRLDGECSSKLLQLLPGFQSLKWLVIFENAKMTKLINGRSSNTTVVFPLLESLRLQRIDNLEEIHKGPISSNSFKNLQELSLESLPKLQHLVNDYLLQLKSLSIRSCPMLEQVVSWNSEENLQNNGNQHCLITFPKLKQLCLHSLPRLTSFCGRIQSIEFPRLTAIRIVNCPNLKNLVIAADSDQDKCTGAIQHADDDSLHFFCKSKVAFGRLEELEIDGISSEGSQSLWCDQISVDFFAGLVRLSVGNFGNINSLFSLSIATNLVNLKRIRIDSCSMLEQVVLWKEEENGQNSSNHRRITFPKLEYLEVNDLPRLASFCKGIQSIEFPQLTGIRIVKCPNLMSLVPLTESDKRCPGAINHSGDDSLHLFCKSEVVFDRLCALTIDGYDCISLWCHQIPIHFFTRLAYLSISECGNIKSLFSPSTTENLVNLRQLVVQSCCEMVTVVEEEEEEVGRSPFIKLEELYLINLPKLKTFFDWRSALHLPSLRIVVINKCPELENFSFGSVTTPNMDYIGKNRKCISDYTKDLNDALFGGDFLHLDTLFGTHL